MTATLDNVEFDWRSQAVCTSGNYDMHFADVEDLIESEGMDREDAEHFAALAEETAKAACLTCPVLAQCRDWALANDQDWGIWGGLNPEERKTHRRDWVVQKAENAEDITPAIRHDLDELRTNEGANFKLVRRNERARAGRDKLVLLDKDWSLPKTRSEAVITRDELLEVCDLVLANPSLPAEDIMAKQGKRGEWLNARMRRLTKALELS